MKDKDEVFKDFGNNTAKQAAKEFGPNTEPVGGRGTDYLLLWLIGIFVFAGAEAVKAIFRKNYAYGKYSKVKLVLCFILFTILGAILFFSSNSNFSESFLIPSILCVGFGLFILVRGLGNVNKAVEVSNRGLSENGDSTLLSFLIEKDENQNFVQNIVEPVLTMLIGGAFWALYNIILGLPLVFCGLSVWVEKLILLIFGDNEVQDTVNQKGYKTKESESISESN